MKNSAAGCRNWGNCRTTSNISFHLCAGKIRHLTVIACLELTVGFNLVPRFSLFPIRASREGRGVGGGGRIEAEWRPSPHILFL